MRKARILILSTLMIFSPDLLKAEMPFQSDLCVRTTSAKEFVQEALAICLSDLPSQRANCMQDAEQAFEECGYTVSFSNLSSRLQAKIVLLSLFKNMLATPKGSVGLASNLGNQAQ